MQFANIKDAKAYALAGNATITLQSLKTGAHFTYKVQAPNKRTEKGGIVLDHEDPTRFVKVLASGSADDGQFIYLGVIRDGKFTTTRASKHMIDAPSVKAFAYFMAIHELGQLVVRHENHCGRCGRTLTHPESIDRGIGPECAGKMGAAPVVPQAAEAYKGTFVQTPYVPEPDPSRMTTKEIFELRDKPFTPDEVKAHPAFSHVTRRPWCGCDILHAYFRCSDSPSGVLLAASWCKDPDHPNDPELQDNKDYARALELFERIHNGPTRGDIAQGVARPH